MVQSSTLSPEEKFWLRHFAKDDSHFDTLCNQALCDKTAKRFYEERNNFNEKFEAVEIDAINKQEADEMLEYMAKKYPDIPVYSKWRF